MNRLVSESNAIVISVEYRLAPEYPLPIGYEDSWAALQWVGSHVVNEPGFEKEPWLVNRGDFAKVFISGDSAGGNIVYNISLRAGTENLNGGIKILGCLLCFPYLLTSKDFEEDSIPSKLWMFVNPSAENGIDDPRINPFVEKDRLSLLSCSKILVCVAENDVLRNLGIQYVEAVKESGWDGVIELIDVEVYCMHWFYSPIGMMNYVFLAMAILGNVKKIIVSTFSFSKLSYVIRCRVMEGVFGHEFDFEVHSRRLTEKQRPTLAYTSIATDGKFDASATLMNISAMQKSTPSPDMLAGEQFFRRHRQISSEELLPGKHVWQRNVESMLRQENTINYNHIAKQEMILNLPFNLVCGSDQVNGSGPNRKHKQEASCDGPTKVDQLSVPYICEEEEKNLISQKEHYLFIATDVESIVIDVESIATDMDSITKDVESVATDVESDGIHQTNLSGGLIYSCNTPRISTNSRTLFQAR
ncbi:CXE carboxylesterase [Capsicum annuum]|nr:CXE carboxylesterase [Capsicum annuum]